MCESDSDSESLNKQTAPKFHQDLHTCLFPCFLSQEEPKRVTKALSDPAWVEAMQEELLQFKLQKVWILVDLPKGHRAIGTKWVYRNKKDKRGIVIRNKAKLVAQGHTQEEGIDYDKVFAHVARIEAIRMFLAYASYMGFMVDKSAEASTDDNGEVKINATIYDGITSIPNSEIFEQLALMGYHTDSDKLTFQKGAFSPQWRIEVLEADLMKTKKTYSSAYTKLILRVKKLESQIKIGKAWRQARVVLSDDEVFEDDSSKQGRKLSNAELQEKASTDAELFIQEVTPTEVIQDQEGSEKASDEVSTLLCKERRKSKKELEQERLSLAEAIRLEEQMNEEQRAQIARDEEIARQWDEEERKRAMAESKSTKKID
ncbi:putative ribonuclease H-like domain-containing protein [Tanacetum coccineum]